MRGNGERWELHYLTVPTVQTLANLARFILLLSRVSVLPLPAGSELGEFLSLIFISSSKVIEGYMHWAALEIHYIEMNTSLLFVHVRLALLGGACSHALFGNDCLLHGH